MRDLNQDTALLEKSLPPLPEAIARPVLVVVSGLPGTGKSHFSRQLAERLSFLILESDALRQVLFPNPSYSAEESSRLFKASHALMERLLRRGIPVIFDATNLAERHREYLYHIADAARAELILVEVRASPEVVQERLQGRQQGQDPKDHSTAVWSIYQRMKPSAERIQRPFLAVDTTQDISPVIEKIVHRVRKALRAAT